MFSKNTSNRTIKALSTVIFGLLIFTGCAKYKPQPLQTAHGVAVKENNVSVSAHAFSELECRYYFSRRMIAKGYQPIQISIMNGSDEDLILDPYNVGLQLESSRIIARACHLNTGKRFVSWFIPALFLWPFIIPAAVECAKSSEANKKLDQDFNQRTISLDSKIYIPAQTTINKVMFVATENYRQNFDIKLIKKNNPSDMVTFDLSL
jgi:hypothetical protein